MLAFSSHPRLYFYFIVLIWYFGNQVFQWLAWQGNQFWIICNAAHHVDWTARTMTWDYMRLNDFIAYRQARHMRHQMFAIPDTIVGYKWNRRKQQHIHASIRERKVIPACFQVNQSKNQFSTSKTMYVNSANMLRANWWHSNVIQYEVWTGAFRWTTPDFK